jgi:riboflavin biosynthesis pyrimidine reductase
MRRLLPFPDEDVNLDAAYAVPSGTRWLRANMVSTIDGSLTGPDGLSGGISGPADKRVFAALRSAADAVMVGASTASAEKYRPARVPVVLVSNRLGIDLSGPLFTSAEHRTIVIAPSSSPPDLLHAVSQVAEVVTAGDGSVDLVAATASLAGLGLRHVLCEGGPRLLGSLLGVGLVDELCTTTSPRVVGGDARRIVDGPWLSDETWHLAQLLEEEGFLFHSWQRP